MAGGALVVEAGAAALAALEPLLCAHRRRREVRVAPLPGAADGSRLLGGAAAVLRVGGAGATPGRSLPGPFLRAPDGSAIPVGWLPDAGARLAVYARAAAEVQDRRPAPGPAGPFVLLGEFDDRALSAVARMQGLMAGEAAVHRWTAERIPRPALVEALGAGAAAAFYLGHGLAGGWAGYGGFGVACAARAAGRPLGAVLSVSCSAAARPRSGLSFCEELVLTGLCAAAFGACRRTLHRLNVELALDLAAALAGDLAPTLAALLLACRWPAAVLARYRIVGDPLAPLLGAPGSLAAARAVFAPGPDDPLPVVPLAAW
ncbi:MAG: hypothetical protein ABR970_19205 [Roseiarcus sp.]|jgi:hypothetical protein